jgi:glycosyltransferase involved in cell wall biosynthesis
MRICLVNISLDAGRGSDLVVSQLATNLSERHDVVVASFRPVSKAERPFAVLAPLRSSSRVARITAFWRFMRELRRLTRQADVVNCHHAVLSLVLPRKKLITTYHGYRGRLNLRFGARVGEAVSVSIRRLLIAPALRKSRLVTLVSRSLYEEAARATIRDPQIIFNGASLPHCERFTAPKTHLLYVGRLDPDKNVAVLLRAYREANLDVPLLVAGEGSERTKLEERYKDSAVEFLGNVSQEILVDLYAGAYAFVTASNFETFCLPVIEAASMGCPSIGPNSGALPEVICDGETGYLVDEPSLVFAQILEKIVFLTENDRRKLEVVSRNWAANFQWATVTKEYEKAYASILTQNSPPALAKSEELVSPRSRRKKA